jgi:hypothetical protein
MSFHDVFSQPLTQVTLPIIIGFFIAVYSQNKRLDDLRSDFNRRFDDLAKRLDEVIKRLDRIEIKLDDHERRITRIEERTSPLRG